MFCPQAKYEPMTYNALKLLNVWKRKQLYEQQRTHFMFIR